MGGFWKWLFLLAKAKFKEAHLNTYYSDIKCPGCQEWFSISGIENKHEKEWSGKGYWVATCGQCKTVSNWSGDIAPMLVRVDDSGYPLDK